MSQDLEILRGTCIVCGRTIVEADFDRQKVLCCENHLSEDGPTGPKYLDAVHKMAQAKADQIKKDLLR